MSRKVFDLTSTQTVLSDFEVTSGSQSSIAADATGLTLSVTQSAPNLVLNSVTTYGPPLSLGVTMRGTDAPGIIPCVVVWSGVSGHDEIDLEYGPMTRISNEGERIMKRHNADCGAVLFLYRLMGGVRDYFMAPIWPHGEQPAYDSEVGVDTDYAAPSWNYVYAPPNNFDSAQEHYYEMHWDGQSISWSIDNTHIVTYNKVTDANWLTEQTVSFRDGQTGLVVVLGADFTFV